MYVPMKSDNNRDESDGEDEQMIRFSEDDVQKAFPSLEDP